MKIYNLKGGPIFGGLTPEKGYSGVNGILELGCCDPGGDTCIGCELGDCAIRQDECLEIGGIAFFTDQICDLSMNSCTPPSLWFSRMLCNFGRQL